MSTLPSIFTKLKTETKDLPENHISSEANDLSGKTYRFDKKTRIMIIFSIGFLLGIIATLLLYSKQFDSSNSLRPSVLTVVDTKPEVIHINTNTTIIRKHIQANNLSKNLDPTKPKLTRKVGNTTTGTTKGGPRISENDGGNRKNAAHSNTLDSKSTSKSDKKSSSDLSKGTRTNRENKVKNSTKSTSKPKTSVQTSLNNTKLLSSMLTP